MEIGPVPRGSRRLRWITCELSYNTRVTDIGFHGLLHRSREVLNAWSRELRQIRRATLVVRQSVEKLKGPEVVSLMDIGQDFM